MQPLMEELTFVRQHVPEIHRPVLTSTKENSQLLKRMHENALELQDSLLSESADAEKRAKLGRIEHEAQLRMASIADEITGAELFLNVEGSPSMAQLKTAAEKLNGLPEQISDTERVFADLDEKDNLTRQLKVKSV